MDLAYSQTVVSSNGIGATLTTPTNARVGNVTTTDRDSLFQKFITTLADPKIDALENVSRVAEMSNPQRAVL